MEKQQQVKASEETGVEEKVQASTGMDTDFGEDSFRDLFEASLDDEPAVSPGNIVRGIVVGRDGESLIVDVGAKAEGLVPLAEFSEAGMPAVPEVGDELGVLISASGRGGIKLSAREALKKEARAAVQQAQQSGSTLEGEILAEIKGGYRVNLGGTIAFLPRSEADLDSRHLSSELLGSKSEMLILSADFQKDNIVVSRRQPQQLLLDEKRKAFFARASVGERVDGVVKRLADFGAFVEVDGVDALLHVSDITWRRLRHPDEVLTVGQKITAEIVKLDPEKGKFSLSMRVLQPDPWKGVIGKYEVGMRLTGTVRRLLDFGAMVELEPGVEGMIHRSEISWTNKEIKPIEALSEGDVVDVAVLEILPEKRRIGLSLKAVKDNPWKSWLSKHPAGTRIDGTVRNITEFGLFVSLSDELDGLVHIGNLSWDRLGNEVLAEFQKGQVVTCVVLGGDIERQRISLGIKQLTTDPFDLFLKEAGRGARVHGTVVELKSNEATLELAKGIRAVLPLREVPRDHEEIKPGAKLEAKIIEVNRTRRQVTLSIKQMQRDEEQEAIRSYSQVVKEEGSSLSALALGLMDLKVKLASKPKPKPKPKVKAKAKPKAATKATAKASPKVKSEAKAKAKPKQAQNQK
ncbi:MAG: S1 RNA-binding domain-containing protein [Mariprofundaceae bacterium]